jgi:hypothetical protein
MNRLVNSILSLVILLTGMSAFAQQTVTGTVTGTCSVAVPTPPPTTVLYEASSGTLTVNGVSVTLPVPTASSSNVSFTNGVLTVNGTAVTALTLNSLTLANGTNYADGKYLINMASSVQTLTPYVAPATGTTTTYTPTYVTVSLPATANVVPAGVVKQTFTVPTGKNAIGVVSTYVGDAWDIEVFSGVLRARNISPANANFPATTVKVAVQ